MDAHSDPLNLGTMSSNEHLDRFLESVERVNAETEMRWAEENQQLHDLKILWRQSYERHVKSFGA